MDENGVFLWDFPWFFPSMDGSEPEEVALRARDEANAIGWHGNHGEILGGTGGMEEKLQAKRKVDHILCICTIYIYLFIYIHIVWT